MTWQVDTDSCWRSGAWSLVHWRGVWQLLRTTDVCRVVAERNGGTVKHARRWAVRIVEGRSAA